MSQIHPLCRCALSAEMAREDDSPAVAAFRERFGALLSAGEAGDKGHAGPAMLVAADRDVQDLVLRQLPGSGDVHYVIVANVQPPRSDGTWQPRKETLTYREDVAGTDLVYDVTGEFMQGKARPFVCDLASLPVRIYAILPFQLEAVAVELLPVESAGKRLTAHVAFCEGSGRRIEGRLPFAATLVETESNRAAWTHHLTTAGDGLGTIAIEAADVKPGQYHLVVRSQLNGQEIAAPSVVDFGPSGRIHWRPVDSPVASRRNPQPFRAAN